MTHHSSVQNTMPYNYGLPIIIPPRLLQLVTLFLKSNVNNLTITGTIIPEVHIKSNG